MALYKSIETLYGVSATYWRINLINQEFNNSSVSRVSLVGYVDEDARNSGASPIESRSFSFEEADITRQDAYELIKSLPGAPIEFPEISGGVDENIVSGEIVYAPGEFADAVDIFEEGQPNG